jgi:hypothetical protein
VTARIHSHPRFRLSSDISCTLCDRGEKDHPGIDATGPSPQIHPLVRPVSPSSRRSQPQLRG